MLGLSLATATGAVHHEGEEEETEPPCAAT
jgi:hypothetical protein